MKVTDEPAATETVVVDPPLAPLTLHLRALSERTVTGELLGTGLMFWKMAPFAPLAVSCWKMSRLVSTCHHRDNVQHTVGLGHLSEGRKGSSCDGKGLHFE